MSKLSRLIFVAVYLATGAIAIFGQGRVLTVNDVLGFEEIAAVQPALDGGLAYLRKGPLDSNLRGRRGGLNSLWVVPPDSALPLEVKNPRSIDTNCLSPVWSPSGKRLAFLSQTGDEPWRVSLFDRASGRFTEFNQRIAAGKIGWLDNDHLIAVVRPKEIRVERHEKTAAMYEWQLQIEGRVPTANILDSGLPNGNKEAIREEAVIIDVASGTEHTLDKSTFFIDFSISPDGHHVALLKQIENNQQNATSRLQWLGEGYFELVVLKTSDNNESQLERHGVLVKGESFRWSLDGSSYAFLGTRAITDKSLIVFRGEVDGKLNEVPIQGAFEFQTLVWGTQNTLLVYAKGKSNFNQNSTSTSNWWAVRTKGVIGPLTSGLEGSAPSTLFVLSGGKAVIGVNQGNLWRLDVEIGKWSSLSSQLGQTVSSIVWPSDKTQNSEKFSHVVFSVSQSNLINYFDFDLISGSLNRLQSPSNSSRLVSYIPEGNTPIFFGDDQTGTFLTTLRRNMTGLVVEMNSNVRQIATGKCQLISYRSLDDSELKGWMILPANYVPGKHYPTVAFVYPGEVYSSKEPTFCRFHTGSSVNLQLLAARGYAVLLPSMPLSPEPDQENIPPSDPYLELSKGVLPALDKAVDLGISDRNRLAVFGQSFGGFGTMGLIEQTNRFKAAIEAAGSVNLTSFYGSFRAYYRYDVDPLEEALSPWRLWAESGQGHMGGPPWKESARYVRNSPISYVDRVSTPLLMIQGDLDMVPITQGEEFFSALQRLGKRARFVRYWGEGHFIESPANIRHYWKEIYAWLDAYCDVSRDNKGYLIFNDDNVKSRDGAPALKPDDFARFDELQERRVTPAQAQ
jgi:dipeptidyl aminopeptidase/acylaminoacyl peptidase